MSHMWRNIMTSFMLAILPVFMAAAQSGGVSYDRRFDVGYEWTAQGYSYDENLNYSGSHYMVRKGVLTASLREYLGDHLFFSTNAEYLLNNQQTFLHGGPLNYHRASLGTDFGMRFDKTSIHLGAAGGVSWDYRVRAETYDGELRWIAADMSSNNLEGRLEAGLTYHLTSYLSFGGSIRRTWYNQRTIRPASHPTYQPAFDEATFSNLSAAVEINVGIPWKSKEQAPPRNDPPPVQPPPMMSVGESSGEKASSSESSTPRFSFPLQNRQPITSGYGAGRNHQGWDIDLQTGDTVRAAAPGTVTSTSRSGDYGRMIEITHRNGFATRYAHLSRILVRDGQHVGRSQPIGLGGKSGRTTGSHLHFELLKNGYIVNPARYMDSK